MPIDDWRRRSHMLARPPQAHDSGVLDSVHFVKRALQEQVYYPEHASRSESSLYAAQHHRLVHSLDSPCLVCGVRNTTLADPRQNKVHAQQMETHHAVIEWALQNAIDVDKFNAQVVLPRRKLGMNKPRYDHDFSEAQMKAWIDHDSDNLIVLCVTPETPVLMADGSERAIVDVRVGDRVIGHDHQPHDVTETMAHPYEGVLVTIDGLCLTPDHPVLAPSGWRPAGALAPGDVVYEIGMGLPQVARLVGVERQVPEPIVGAVSVVVVDALTPTQPAPEMLLHDPSVLHYLATTRVVPAPGANIASVVDHTAAQSRGSWARLVIEPGQTATVRAELLIGPVDRSFGRPPARVAREAVRETPAEPAAALATAAVGTGRVARRVGGRDQVRTAADRAQLQDTVARVSGAWRAIRRVGRLHYSGMVHDLRVSGSHSFVAAGVAVHNCDVHHRHTLVGIHSVTYPIWNVQSLIRDDFQLTPYALHRIESVEARHEAAENDAELS